MFSPFTLPAFFLTLLLPLSNALTNHTIDQGDNSISYSGQGWSFPGGALDASGNHTMSTDPSAYASFSFTGVAFYFMSAKWPERVTTAISIDGQTPVVLDLQNHGVPDTSPDDDSYIISSSVVGIFQGLQNGPHTVKMSVPPGDGYVVVDRLIYTTLDPGDTITTPSSTTPPTPSGSSTPYATTSQPTHSTGGGSTSDRSSVVRYRKLAVGLGAGGAFASLALISLLLWFCIRRKGRKHRDTHIPPPMLQEVVPMLSHTYPGDGADGGYYQPPQPTTTGYHPPSQLPPAFPIAVHSDARAPNSPPRQPGPGYGLDGSLVRLVPPAPGQFAASTRVGLSNAPGSFTSTSSMTPTASTTSGGSAQLPPPTYEQSSSSSGAVQRGKPPTSLSSTSENGNNGTPWDGYDQPLKFRTVI